MDPTSALSQITGAQALLAGIIILGHLMSAVSSRTRRSSGWAIHSSLLSSPAEQLLAAVVSAAQITSAVLTVLEWLHRIGAI